MRLLEKNRDMRPASALVLIQEIEKIEKDMSNPGRTRVLTADDLVRASESRGLTRAAGRGLSRLLPGHRSHRLGRLNRRGLRRFRVQPPQPQIVAPPFTPQASRVPLGNVGGVRNITV